MRLVGFLVIAFTVSLVIAVIFGLVFWAWLLIGLTAKQAVGATIITLAITGGSNYARR